MSVTSIVVEPVGPAAPPAGAKLPPGRQLRLALTEALMGSSGSDGGLPVPPLIEIVAQYASLVPLTVSTVVSNSTTSKERKALDWPLNCVLWYPHKSPDTGTPATAAAAVNEEPVLLITNFFNHQIMALNITTYEMKAFAGNGRAGHFRGSYTDTEFNNPAGLCIDPIDNSILVSENTGNRVQRLKGGTVTLIAGSPDGAYGSDDGEGTNARFSCLSGMCIASTGAFCIASDRSNSRLRRIDLTATPSRVSTIRRRTGGDSAGSAGSGAVTLVSTPQGIQFDRSTAVPDTVCYVAGYNTMYSVNIESGIETEIKSASADNPRGVLWINRDFVLQSSTSLGIHLIHVTSTDPNGPTTERIVGRIQSDGARGADGAASEASFSSAAGMALLTSAEGDDRLFVCDSGNHRIRCVSGSILASILAGGKASLDH